MGTASLAVVGVLLERGAKEPNPAVQLALDAAPRQAAVKVQVGFNSTTETPGSCFPVMLQSSV